MANGFPIIGPPIPREGPVVGTPLSPVPSVPQLPAAAAPNGEDFFTRIANDPAAITALLQFSGGLLQPKGVMDTSAGIFGKALAGAATSFQKQKNVEGRQGELKKRTGLLERQVKAEEEQLPSEIALNQATASMRDRMPRPNSAQIQRQMDLFQKQKFGEYFGITDPTELEVEWLTFKTTDGANVEAVQKAKFFEEVAATMPQFFTEQAPVQMAPPDTGGLVPGGREQAPEPGGDNPLLGVSKEKFQQAVTRFGRAGLVQEFGEAAVNEAYEIHGIK